MGFDYKSFIKEYWHIAVLLVVFIAALKIRLLSAGVSNLTAFDPYFHMRYVGYILEQGALPAWDYFSYAPVGRPLDIAPLMDYISAWAFTLFGGLAGGGLERFLIYMPAFYGAITVVPAYLLGKELSGKMSGLISAVFIGVSPAILQRSMAGFYDTDGLVIFFSVLTLWAFVRAAKRQHDINSKLESFRGYASVFLKRRMWIDYSIYTAVLILFALTWGTAWYMAFIVIASTGLYWAITSVFGKYEWKRTKKTTLMRRIRMSFPEFMSMFVPATSAFLIAAIVTEIMGYNTIGNIKFLLGFAVDPTSLLIVNQSVAELQKVSIFSNNLSELYFRVSMPVVFAVSGAMIIFRRSRLLGSILLAWSSVSFISITQGIRFMLVFAPAAGVAAAVALSDSFRYMKKMGSFSLWISSGMLLSVIVALKNPLMAMIISVAVTSTILLKKDHGSAGPLAKALGAGAIVLSLIVTVSAGAQVATSYQSSEPIDADWSEAFQFLREETAEDSIVGTWWDPGHRITSIGDRRTISDGAHCPYPTCKPGFNERIVDLGFIFSTNNETAAKERLLKYRGEGDLQASEMYWIVSDDLIQKFQWLQFFGTGCDFRRDPSCELYSRLGTTGFSYDINTYEPAAHNFQGGVITVMQEGVWIAGARQEGEFLPFNRQITYLNGSSLSLEFNGGLERTVWVHPENSYVVLIPPSLENNMFTRMFFLEDEFESFDLVFRNERVKIYKLAV